MAKKIAPKQNARSETSGTVLKPALFAGLAILALAAIVWLAAVSLAPAPKNILPVDAMEFMQATAAYNDSDPIQRNHIYAEGEWRMTPASHAPDGETPFPAREVPQSSPARLEAGKSRGGYFKLPEAKLPEAGRNLLASRAPGAAPSRRQMPESGGETTLPDGVHAAYARLADDAAEAELQPPSLALMIARAAIADQPALPDADGAESGRGVMPIQPIRLRPGAGGSVASSSAFASASGLPPLNVDDLFALKLHGEYGTSKASLSDGGSFRDRFLLLGGKKKFDFAGMDQVDVKFDGIITTGGNWDISQNDYKIRQDLSGITLNAGPEIKFPELPVKLDLNLGVGWLKREATTRTNAGIERADIDSMVYGGGAALRNDWQWRMFSVTGLAGIQYAAATDKSYSYRAVNGGAGTAGKMPKLTRSAWEIPVQLRIGGEYKLLNALSILPSLWGGYTHNLSGTNGAFHSGHVAGAEATWRRHGMTWNRSSWNFGGEFRIRAVDRFELWIAHQKEWAGEDSGSYTGGGLQIAF